MMMPTMKNAARFSSRCVVSSGLRWGFQCKAGQGGGGSLNEAAMHCWALQCNAMQCLILCNALQSEKLKSYTLRRSGACTEVQTTLQ